MTIDNVDYPFQATLIRLWSLDKQGADAIEGVSAQHAG